MKGQASVDQEPMPLLKSEVVRHTQSSERLPTDELFDTVDEKVKTGVLSDEVQHRTMSFRNTISGMSVSAMSEKKSCEQNETKEDARPPNIVLDHNSSFERPPKMESGKNEYLVLGQKKV